MDGEVFLTLKDNVPTVESYETLFHEVDIASVDVLSEKFIVLNLTNPSRQGVIDAIEELKENQHVCAAEPNYKLEADSANATPVITNDPLCTDELQWHISHIEADTAWNYATGSSTIKVGVVDTGTKEHIDLLDNLDMESGINYVYIGWPATDDVDHGTHVSGIIGAVGNNEIGVAGICWDVTIVPFKVMDAYGQLDMDNVVSAILDATEMGIDILNCSFGKTEYGYGLMEAIQDYDGLLVCSAGNTNDNLGISSAYPRCLADVCDNIIVVGNSTPGCERYVNPSNPEKGSNYGDEEVHLFAPGVNIYSTSYQNPYDTFTGTSMSAPMVTGAAALIMSEYPNATPAQIKDALVYSVNKYDALEDYCISSGILNVRRAIEYLSDLHGNGDVTMDGTINNIDLIKLARYIVFAASEDFSYDSTDSRALNEDQLMRADMNKDNVINELDSQALGQYLVQRSLNLEIQ